MASKKKEPKVGNILGVPAKDLQEYVKFFDKNNLKELSVKEKGITISLKRKDATEGQPVFMPGFAAAPALQTPPPAPAAKEKTEKTPATQAEEDDSSEKITSPIIGTFYAAPSPGAPAFVKEGQQVSKGDTLCIIEAMKVMNKISAEFNCRIVKILVQNGQAVKTGEPLFLVEK
jgi:acetyl-CoA carboxylase biotin carboxyl carrier protein